MAGLEGFPGGRGEPRAFREKQSNYDPYIGGDPRRPAAGGRRGKVGYQQETEQEASAGETDKYAGFGVSISGLIAENLLCHPFMILRRQCQVHVESARYHTTPVTLLPVILNLNRWQGTSALFKGVGSSLTIKGMSLGIEDAVSKFTPWPKEVNRHSSLKMVGQHILLKCVSTAIITPFYSASLVETVQSDIASEKPGVLDVFREGIVRLVSWSDPRCGRMLPVWVLIPPQIVHSILHYGIKLVMERFWLHVLKNSHREFQRLKGAVSRDPDQSLPGLAQYQTQASGMLGHLVADVILFPLETVLHRLHLQGTRSIIDNLDSGREVIPILTRYEGVSDCFSTILREEGVRGLFKGFGALMLQYTVHFLIIKFSSQIISRVAQVITHPSLPFNAEGKKEDLSSTPGKLATPGVQGGPGKMSASGVGGGSTNSLAASFSSLRENLLPENIDLYGSVSSLREQLDFNTDPGYADSVSSISPRRNLDHFDSYQGSSSSRKSWKSMENL